MAESARLNPYQQAGCVARKYQEIRPSYPSCVLDWLLTDVKSEHMSIRHAHTGDSAYYAHPSVAGESGKRAENVTPHSKRAHSATVAAVDIGAGTGILTRQLYERGCSVVAVEPSADMRREFRTALPDFPAESLFPTSAEATGLADSSCDLATYGQCWHWLNEADAAQEAARIVRPGGVVGVLVNQLAVEEPWVLRLSRIMRSGDVARLSRPPRLGICFSDPQVYVHKWMCPMLPDDICKLGTTRASWLRARPEARAWMRGNLRWYLYQYLGLRPEERVNVPYHTYAWKFRRISSLSSRR